MPVSPGSYAIQVTAQLVKFRSRSMASKFSNKLLSSHPMLIEAIYNFSVNGNQRRPLEREKFRAFFGSNRVEINICRSGYLKRFIYVQNKSCS